MAPANASTRGATTIAVGRIAEELHFHALSEGPTQRGGILDADAIAHLRAPGAMAVFRDSALLSLPLVRTLTAAPVLIGLLPPLERPDESPEEIAAAARALPASVAVIGLNGREALEPYLREIGRSARLLDDLDDSILDHVEASAPDYAALLRHGRRLRPNATAVLRRHPSPRTIRGDSPRMLSGLLGDGDRLNDHLFIEQLVRIGGTSYALPGIRDRVELAERVVPGLVDTRDSVARHLATLRYELYRLAGPASPTAFTTPALALEEGLPLAVASVRGRVHETRPDTESLSLDEIVGRCRAAGLRRCEPDGSAIGYEEYRAARVALEAHPELDPLTRAELEVIGQQLAVDCSDFTAESGHAAAVEGILEALPPEQRHTTAARRIEADSALVNAIAAIHGVDSAASFPALRTAIINGADASPDVLFEARGLLAYVLALYGELPGAHALIAELGAEAEGVRGAARAPYDIARLFTTGSVSDDEALVEARARAARSAPGTSMVAFHEYTLMLTSYLSKDANTGLDAHKRFLRECEQRPVSPRIQRMAGYSRALLQAAVGDLAGARASIAAPTATPWFEPESGDSFVRALILARIRLAAGAYEQVLAATAPGGPISETAALRMQARYAPACLAARAAALRANGERSTSSGLFHRALAMSAAQNEYIALLGCETPELRDWLRELDPAEYPPGVDADTVAAILRRPLFVEMPLPQLTRQERKVLFLLSTGRSAAAIAAELTISANTIKTHLRQIYRKLGVSSREQAVVVADERGLLL